MYNTAGKMFITDDTKDEEYSALCMLSNRTLLNYIITSPHQWNMVEGESLPQDQDQIMEKKIHSQDNIPKNTRADNAV